MGRLDSLLKVLVRVHVFLCLRVPARVRGFVDAPAGNGYESGTPRPAHLQSSLGPFQSLPTRHAEEDTHVD